MRAPPLPCSLSLCALLFLVGCGDGDGDRGADSGSSDYAVNIVSRGCGPGDGPTLVVLLGPAYDQETCTLDYASGPSATIVAYLSGPDITAPVTWTISPDDFTGTAQTCPGGAGPCPQATSAELHLDDFEDGFSAIGTFHITTVEGTTEGSFDADWCDSVAGNSQCG
jgi:hypothetical protein